MRITGRINNMQQFWIRLVSLLIIAGSIMGYNFTVERRKQDDKIAQMTAEIETLKAKGTSTASDNGSAGAYTDGTYEGSADGFGGNVSVEVEISDGAIAQINVTDAAKEDGAYLTMAEDIIPAIISAQSADVDTISGATFSSTAIKNATKEALEKAVK